MFHERNERPDVALTRSPSAMFWKKKGVRVVFVDVAGGREIASSDMAPEQLPESFEAHTTVSIKGQEWEVVSSTPMTRAEFVALGRLRIEVRKINVTTTSPKDMLYSLPTICDVIPAVVEGSTKRSKHVLELHEDHWRQIELVSAAYLEEIRSCLAKVQRVHDEERVGPGFKNLYVRKELSAPIAVGAITLDALRGSFEPSPTVYDGVAYEGAAGLIGDAFAFRTASLDVYGSAPKGEVAVVGLIEKRTSKDESDVRALAALLREHQLFLVDWCRVTLVKDSDDEVAAYFSAPRVASPSALP